MIEEVSDLWHGSGNFVSFRGLLFHILRTTVCEISFRSTCIFLFLLHSFDDSAIFELWRAARSRFQTLLNYVIANKLLRSRWTRPIESVIPFVTDRLTFNAIK